ncbi:MAG TPA: hypothetical protein VGR07_03470 [Thermoanaerobaculia bacterium]|jgi:penicillin V acylase-like amidase (Ntn superfamily)|nr:hypothetical protein [Thermoanaerobaculia bacterium]
MAAPLSKVIFGWRYKANQEGHGQALLPADREPNSRFDFLFRLDG